VSQPFRTISAGRLADRKPVRFKFDGRDFEGLEGDTLASALLANGVHMIARSYKYHRPRGVFTAGAEEPNALVGLSRGAGRFTPNLRATQIELYDGLDARSQNCWPSLSVDVGAINGLFPALLSAGFYYKTFMGPRWLGGAWVWRRVFEPVIRRAAGLGSAPTEPDPDRYAQFYDHCDVLVVGAGPAGLAATRAAGETGARVVLCDEQSELGGSLMAETSATIDGRPAWDWLSSELQALAALPNVRLMPRTQAFGYFAQNFVALNERVTDHLAAPDDALPRERLWQMRAKHVVLATGAIERPLVFPDNDRPGVMLADAAGSYLKRYGVKVGTRIVIATAHDSAYRAALDLTAAGVQVPLIADMRATIDGALPQLARQAGLRIAYGARIGGTRGRTRVAQATILSAGRAETIDCDAVLMSGGWTPSIHLYSQSRGKPVFNETIGAFVPGAPMPNQSCVGGCAGTLDLANALADGAAAGLKASAAATASARRFVVAGAPPAAGSGLVAPDAFDGASAFVDFQNDVCAKDIALAVREGMHSIEHVKRYTTTGMATDQGKTSNLNALALVANMLGKPVPAVGHTTFRQPYTPVTFGNFAGLSRGELFDPVRRTPIHGWAEENGAAFEDVGLWKRAWFFPKPNENMHAAVMRECRQTRASVGMLDASTLGKIEVVGPDAAVFLERMYTNPWVRLEPGRCRYGLMLNEAGFVIDDGVVARIAHDRFHVTTTTGGASRVLAHMEDYLQTEFQDLKVWLTSTTEQWTVIAVQGPRARELLAPLVEGFDISREAMPHMSVREGRFCEIPARVMRVSFTGELGFEINVPSDYGRAAWEAVWDRGKTFDCVAYGTEAMHVMRAEKGFIIVGQETDGTVTPSDVGLDWAIGKAKKDFVGKRSLSMEDLNAVNRPQLVGLLTKEPNAVIEEGAQIVGSANPSLGEHAVGHVTSSYLSPALGRSIALALIEGGRGRIGEQVFATASQGALAARIVKPIFFDAEGVRLNG
jgi:sarcosine oxidase, subunit alpha